MIAPSCYRCPLNLRFPSCHTACLNPLEDVLSKLHRRVAGVIIEPLVQAVAGMMTQPPGYLSRVRALCTKYRVLLIADVWPRALAGPAKCSRAIMKT